jgi:hypothetical protein
MRTDRPFACAANADAAFLRMCSGGHLAAKQISPNQPFKARKLGKTNLSLHDRSTIMSCDKPDLCKRAYCSCSISMHV